MLPNKDTYSPVDIFRGSDECILTVMVVEKLRWLVEKTELFDW